MNTCVFSLLELRGKSGSLKQLHHWKGILPPCTSISQHTQYYIPLFLPWLCTLVKCFLLHCLSTKLHINMDICCYWSLVCLLLSSQEQQNVSVWYRVQLKPLMASTTLSPRKYERCLRAPRSPNQSAYCSRRLLLTPTASNRWDTVEPLPGQTGSFSSLRLWVTPLAWIEHGRCFAGSL